jgi:hypothetical protein
MELMLRSLFARHSPHLNLSITVVDNASEDDMTGLRAYAERIGIPIVQSGFSTRSQHNSHGEILSRFVLEHPDCTHYLFLDADVCFIKDNTLGVMQEELDATPAAFGIGARLSWDGIAEIPDEVRAANPDLYAARLHPCCALIKNTTLFRQVVSQIGLSEVRYVWAEREEFVDTCKLMTRVMRTHGFKHLISSRMVVHFSCVSYDWDPHQMKQQKERHRDRRLAALRALETCQRVEPPTAG